MGMTCRATDDAAQLHCMVSILHSASFLNIFPNQQLTPTFTKMLKLAVALALLATAVAVPLSHITADQGNPPIKLETNFLVVATLMPPSFRFAPHTGVPQLHGHLWPLLQLR
jgi:hypothetical protein